MRVADFGALRLAAYMSNWGPLMPKGKKSIIMITSVVWDICELFPFDYIKWPGLNFVNFVQNPIQTLKRNELITFKISHENQN